MATIGLRDLFMAPITEDATGVEQYGTPTRMAKAITAELSVETAEATLYADDGVDITEKEFVSGELKIGANDLAPEVVAALLGQTMDDDGVLYGGEDDDPPYFAIGFRAKKPRGQWKYLWIYKIKFSVPDEKYETKGDSISFVTPELTGTFIKREDGKWKAEYVGLTTDAPAAAWFTAVREPVTA